MKTILSTTLILIVLAVACNAMSATERIIISKSMETSPISLAEQPDPVIYAAVSRPRVHTQPNHLDGLGCFAAKALKDIGSFMGKRLCTLSKLSKRAKNHPRYRGMHDHDLRISVRDNYSMLLR